MSIDPGGLSRPTPTSLGKKSTSAQSSGAAGKKADAVATAKEQAELRKACQLFEAQFLKMIFKEMRKTLPKGGLMHGGAGEDIFTDLKDEAVSDSLAQSGTVGLAALLEAQLSSRGVVRPGAKMGQPLTGGGESAAGSLQAPLKGRLTSAFGLRTHPLTGEDRPHQGVDLAAPEGTPIAAAAAGQVSFAGEQGDYGNLVVVSHADGSTTYYGHCQEIKVAEGQEVSAGQMLASVGASGLATGPHLHFEVRDSRGEPRDPLPLLAGAVSSTA